MTDRAEIVGTIAQYSKHGWSLRRVLLSTPIDDSIDGVAVENSLFDGLWFTRVSSPGTETWELRRLGGSPYALVTVISDDDDDIVRNEALGELEKKMLSTVRRGN